MNSSTQYSLTEEMRFWWFNLKRDTAVVVVVIAGVCTCLVSGTMYAGECFEPGFCFDVLVP
jgi:hypothetical protein